MRANLEENGNIIVEGVDVRITKGVPASPTSNVPQDECAFNVTASTFVNVLAQHRLIFLQGGSRGLHIKDINEFVVTGGPALKVIRGVLDR